jgi:uncharacterized protein
VNREHVVMVFARAPVIRTVKTRLAATVGDERALQVYRAMGKQVVEQLLDGSRTYDVCVRCTPGEKIEEVRAWISGADAYVAQGDGDLGARLGQAVHDAFQNGYRTVTLVGTDCLAVNTARVQEAIEAMTVCDAALGAAYDGGYYLLAMRSALQLFDGIAWSTDTVATSTRNALRALGCTWHELPQERDVDTEEDLVAESSWFVG